MVVKFGASLFAILSVSTFASQAHAEIIHLVETGIVGDAGTGIADFFGTNVYGLPYERIFTINTSAIGAVYTTGSGYRELEGGQSTPYAPSPSIVSYSLSINGLTLSGNGITDGFIELQYYGSGDETLVIHSFDTPNLPEQPRGDLTQMVVNLGQTLPSPGEFVRPGVYTVTSPQNGSNAGFAYEYTNPGVNNNTETLAQYYLESEKLVVTITNGVPEPGAWALMLAGFGGVGIALRMRRNLIPLHRGALPSRM